MSSICAIIVPAVTPFDENGEINFEMLKYNYEKWNKTDVSGYMCLGSNGEFRMLSDDESFEVICASSKYAAKDKCFIVGVARESLYHTLKFIERLQNEDIKIDYFSVLTPHYFKSLMTDEALIEYFTAIADFAKKPILLYCAPMFSNDVAISAEVVKALADHPNIHGVKDTSKIMLKHYMDVAGERDDFEILAGSITTILECMDRGGKGGVVAASNYFPQECANVVKIYNEQGKEKAYEYYEEISKVIKKTGSRFSVAGVKCCMNLVGFKGGYPRKPILPVSKEVEDEMKQALIEADYI